MKAGAATEPLVRRVRPRGAAAAQPTPRGAERVVLARADSAGQAIGALLESALRQVEDNARIWQANAHPEALHQLRVGIRRLRATLSIAKRVLPAEPTLTLKEALAAIAQVLGVARDADVFVEETLPAVRAAAKVRARRALDALLVIAQRRRAAARRKARAILTGPRLTRLHAQVTALAAACVSGGDVLADPAHEFARAVLKRRHRRLLERLHDVAALDVEQRHALRIATKKLRYAAEGLGSLFSAARVGPYRRALAEAQTALGAMNDAAVAVALAGEMAAASSARNAVDAWAAARQAELDDELSRAARRFAKVRRFWTRA